MPPRAQPLPPLAVDQFADVSFPLAGLDNSRAFNDWTPKQLPSQEFARTAQEAMNVRSFDAITQRMRGGVRSGIKKYVPAAVVAGWLVQGIDVVVYTKDGGMTQQNQAGRVVTLVAVSQGRIFFAASGATSWTEATNATSPLAVPPLNYTGILYSTSLNQKLYFADGVNWVYFDPTTSTAYTWVASAGTLPNDGHSNAPRLICTWRGRCVLSGLLFDPQNWFMSAVGDPTNFDYAPSAITPTQAVAGNNSPLGLVGDVITSLIPYSDDTLIVGGDHTIYQFSGDPMAGGQIDLISDSIGMAWGQPWCKDPYGTIYFLSNRTGIYQLQASHIQGVSSAPQRISQQIEQLLLAYDTGTTTFRMMWNDRFQGLHVFASPTLAPGTTTHFFYELRTGAWWTDQFANTNHDPLTCVVFDGNTPGDRTALIGSWDGYVRSIDPSAVDDDGTPIASSVVIGPVTTKNLDDFNLKDLQAVLGETSGSVTFDVYVGATAELALGTASIATGTWLAGRNLTSIIRRAGHAVYIKISSANQWAMEVVRARVAGQGKIRRRGA